MALMQHLRASGSTVCFSATAHFCRTSCVWLENTHLFRKPLNAERETPVAPQEALPTLAGNRRF